MVRENGDFVQDGADEKMLGSDDKESLALKNIEVKFISGDQNQNGDAKIDIGGVEKVSWQLFAQLLNDMDIVAITQLGVNFAKSYKLMIDRWTKIQY